MGRASIIEAYIQQLLAWDQPITPEALHAMAQELGITAGELAAIDLKVNNHLVCSRRHLNAGNLSSAIDELVQASNLAPVNNEVLNTLASLFYQRYQKENNLSDRQQTLLIAERCVELYPQDKSAQALLKRLNKAGGYQVVSRQQRPQVFTLIDQFQKITDPGDAIWWTQATLTHVYNLTARVTRQLPSPASLVPKPSPTTKDKVSFFVGYMAVASLAFVGVSRLMGFSSPTPNAIISNANLFSREGAANPKTVDDLVSIPIFDPGPNIPVTFRHPGLFMEPRLSRLGEYDGADYYKFHGVLINDSGQEVRKLDLKVELLDGDGEAIATINQAAVSNNSIGPGGTHPFELFHKITPDLIRVRVSVIDIEQVVGNKPYEPPIPRDFSLGSQLLMEENQQTLISRRKPDTVPE